MDSISIQIADGIKRASPTILTCIGAAGVIVTAVLSVKATPKALESIEDARKKKILKTGANLTKMETVKVSWKYYIPAALCAAATIGCIFGANAFNIRQQASLLSAYAFLDQSYRRYQKATKDIYGEEGHEKVMDRIMAEDIEQSCIYNSLTGERYDFGDIDEEKHLFYDELSHRYFNATYADVLLAELHVNRNFIIGGGEISLSNFYEFLGLDTPDELKELAWYVCDDFYFIDFVHKKHYIDDGPERLECWVIEMPFPPTLEPLDYYE